MQLNYGIMISLRLLTPSKIKLLLTNEYLKNYWTGKWYFLLNLSLAWSFQIFRTCYLVFYFGEKLPLFVIDKSKKPRCFKHIKHLPCRYRSQKKSWMDSILFDEWVREVDRRFTKEGRKIILLVDNWPAHPSIDNLVSTELIFLPPNTTSKLQPMNEGVIWSMKVH